MIAGLLAVYMIGCGADDEDDYDIRIDMPISETPPNSIIRPYDSWDADVY